MPPRRLLLVKLSSLGDIAHALPLADALRAGLGPDAFLGWAVRGAFAPLLAGNPNLDAVYAWNERGLHGLSGFARRLREERFDTALDAQGLLVSGLVAFLSGAPRRIGFDRNREGNALFMTEACVPARQRAHMVEKLLGFCDALRLPRLPPRPQAYLADAEAGRAEALLAPAVGGKIVGCIVGASTPDKAWPTTHWAQLARTLASAGLRPVLLGGPGEATAGQAIAEQAGAAVAANLIGRTDLRTLGSTLARCAAVVGGDSGPTHLAVAVGTPVVGLYGVTDPARTGADWGAAPAIVLDHATADAPPERRRPRHATLPDALARIPVPAVAEAVQNLV